ncbi:DUF3817 domain-containing protein [Microbacterium sp. 69-7]|uniref:DUF3817 domain-containing protein n=1 Tax=Microbacterium sp. 69-7 TaxID=1895784 RepID=UPI00338D9FE9
MVKYPLQGSPHGVTVAGWVHGIAWIAFVIACLAAAIRFRWAWWVTLLGLVMSVLPFLTVPFDIWMERTRRLGKSGRAWTVTVAGRSPARSVGSVTASEVSTVPRSSTGPYWSITSCSAASCSG